MEEREIKDIIFREFPGILERDPQVQDFIVRLVRPFFADKRETESRFERLLEEFQKERERQDRRWEDQRQEWNRRWEEQRQEWREQQAEWNKKWEEQRREWEEQQAEWNRKWEEQREEWRKQQAEWNKKWEENQRTIAEMLGELKALSRKHDATIGALGARWGLYTGESFRNALKGILEKIPGLEVIRAVEYDFQGEVFGHPDQVELDLIIREGLLIICEIKSSMSKADMYVFDRKARFYEKRNQRQAHRRMVISPMVDSAARQVAEKLGILVYSYTEDIPREILEP